MSRHYESAYALAQVALATIRVFDDNVPADNVAYAIAYAQLAEPVVADAAPFHGELAIAMGHY